MDIEHGKTVGTLATWHAFAHAFGLSYDRLFSPMCNGHKLPRAEPGSAGGDDDR